MHLTAKQRTDVAHFIAVRKFGADPDYVGYMSDDVVADPEAALNALAKRALERSAPSRSDFLAEAKTVLDRFELADTEDRERALLQIERLKQAMGLPAFEGRLSAFRDFDTKSGGRQ